MKTTADLVDKIQWMEPREITERKLREETFPGLRKMFRQCTRYYLMAAVPIGILCFFVAHSVLPLLTLALFIYLLPVSIWLNVLQSRKSGVKHQVDKVGVRANVRRFYWRQVEGFNFTDYEGAPDVGCLNVKISELSYWLSLPFHRSEVNEPELSALMARHLPKAISAGGIDPEVHLRRLRERQRWYKRNKYISLALLVTDVVAVLLVWKGQVVDYDWVLNCSFLWVPMFLLLIFVMTASEVSVTKKIAKLETPPAG